MAIFLSVCEKCGRTFRDTQPFTDCTRSSKYDKHLEKQHGKFDIHTLSKPDKKSGKRKHRKDGK